MQSIDDTQIATAAYNLWLAEGQPEGRDFDHWVRARAELEAAAPAPKKRRAAAKPKAAAAPKAAKKPRKKAVN